MKHLLIALSLIFLLSVGCSSSSYAGVDLNGDADYINCTDNASLILASDTPLTIAFWMNADTAVGGGDYPIMVGIRDSNNDGYWIENNGNTNTIIFVTHDTGYNNANIAEGSIVDGTWHHLVAVFRGTGANEQIFYLDGIETVTVSGGYDSPTGNTNEFYIGLDAVPTQWFYEGKISEVAFWDTALTSQEIALLYNSKIKGMPLQIQPDNLVGYWPLDDVADGSDIAGATFYDRAGINHATGTDADGDSKAVAEAILSYP